MCNQFVLRYTNNGIWYGVFTHFAAYGLIHGISTRLHGHSTFPFHSLNLGLHIGDNHDKAVNNRLAFATALGLNPGLVVTAQQVHGTTIRVVNAADKGAGFGDYSQALPATDALITADTGIPLMLFFADCVPILFFDPVQRVVAISHSGWKGTVSRIAADTLIRLQQEFNTNPKDCLIGIGPSIGQCCYEVDDVVIDRLRQEFTNNWSEFVLPKADRWLLDLWAVNRYQLLDAGASEENIVSSEVCTACNTELFYSHRAEQGMTGRMGAVIQL